ncbi:hypothetical protein [Spirosoma pollinicola]|uniref:Uncharacterized protein n=1 Tax=Spirosoma pollinicola TaxID=2057025 RepID=A0A2K8Z6Z5_9BACT|nr:hypothetical protein [Spirosoma pollinicola]AUD05589.1 hypothetical protein CWM47_29350 [Spirosoma pollinicola]
MSSQELPTLDELVYRLERIRRINEQIRQFSDKTYEVNWDDFMLQQLISQKVDLLDKLDSTLLALELKPVLEELLLTHP